MVRVAALELDGSSDTEESLASCLQLIDRAVRESSAELVVCPQLAVEGADGSEDGAGMSRLEQALAERAREHAVWLVCNVVAGAERIARVFDPRGESVALSESGLCPTPFGNIAVCSGAELLHSKVVRTLAIAGAELICASVGELPESDLRLHAPARALENHVFLAVAGLVRSRSRPYPAHLETLPPELPAAGLELPRAPIGQLVDPTGAVHAGGDAGSDLVCLSLDLTLAAQKERADGTPLLGSLRPEIYRSAPRSRSASPRRWEDDLPVAALDLPAARSLDELLLDERVYLEALRDRGVQLVVLPELFCFDADFTERLDQAADSFTAIVRELSAACERSSMHVATSLVERVGDTLFHMGVLIGQRGIVMRQPQLHVPKRHAWAHPGRRVESAPLPWGMLALAVGEDALVPELCSAFAAAGAELVAAPLAAPCAEDAVITLPAQADEHGYAVVAAVPLGAAGAQSRSASHLVVDPSAWPARRALPDQRVLHGTLRLSVLERRLTLGIGSNSEQTA